MTVASQRDQGCPNLSTGWVSFIWSYIGWQNFQILYRCRPYYPIHWIIESIEPVPDSIKVWQPCLYCPPPYLKERQLFKRLMLVAQSMTVIISSGRLSNNLIQRKYVILFQSSNKEKCRAFNFRAGHTGVCHITLWNSESNITVHTLPTSHHPFHIQLNYTPQNALDSGK